MRDIARARLAAPVVAGRDLALAGKNSQHRIVQRVDHAERGEGGAGGAQEQFFPLGAVDDEAADEHLVAGAHKRARSDVDERAGIRRRLRLQAVDRSLEGILLNRVGSFGFAGQAPGDADRRADRRRHDHIGI